MNELLEKKLNKKDAEELKKLIRQIDNLLICFNS